MTESTLVLGCGKRTKVANELLCDRIGFPDVDVVHDLDNVPWPWADNQFLRIDAVHLVEHLHSLVSFMDECWRILKPGGSLFIRTPLAGTSPDLEWADPTHRRCYRIHTFANYFSPEGVAAFAYTKLAWNFFVLRVEDNCIIAHAYPLKQ